MAPLAAVQEFRKAIKMLKKLIGVGIFLESAGSGKEAFGTLRKGTVQ